MWIIVHQNVLDLSRTTLVTWTTLVPMVSLYSSFLGLFSFAASTASMYTRTILATRLERRNQIGGTPTTKSCMMTGICSIYKVGTLWVSLASFPFRTLISPESSLTTGQTNIHGCPSGRTGPISAF